MPQEFPVIAGVPHAHLPEFSVSFGRKVASPKTVVHWGRREPRRRATYQKRAGNDNEVARRHRPLACGKTSFMWNSSSGPALASWPGELAELVALLVAH
jgi:hypothetical protein